MIILDTNVLSEVLRPKPHEGGTAGLRALPAFDVFTTTICEAEIFYGIELLPRGKRCAGLEAVAVALFETDFAPPRAVKPAAPSANSTRRLRLSRGPVARRWRQGMFKISQGVA